MHADSEGYRLEFIPRVEIPDFLIGEIQAKLAYVDEEISGAKVSERHIALQLRSSLEELPPERLAELEDKTQRVILSMARGAFKPKVLVLEDHLDRHLPYKDDPMPELIARSEVSQEAPGIYTLGPLVSRLVDFFDKHFLALGASFEALPYRFPTLVPAPFLERVNYFSAFPHSLTFVTHLREDLDVIDQFAQEAATDETGLNTARDSFARIRTLLSPAVCYHLYFSLADRSLPGDTLVATAVGNCFRYEAINLTSLERMWNFTMREVIFVGPKDFVLENREAARQQMASVFADFGLSYKVESANDPFFIGEFRKQAAFQSAFQLKFEIRARLPFKDSTLAVGSYNYHQDFFGRSLDITLSDGSPVHTGCAAFGLERFVFAFLTQYGTDPRKWPQYVRQSIQ